MNRLHTCLEKHDMFLRKAKTTDLEQLINLQESSVDPIMFDKRDSESFLKAIEESRFVVMTENHLIVAYSIMENACLNMKQIIDVDCDKMQVGRFSGTVLHPEHKGKGIQKELLNSHIEYCLKHGYNKVMALVHPDNIASKKNIMKNGLFHVKTDFIESKNGYREIYKRVL